jgi:hypothetical protein
MSEHCPHDSCSETRPSQQGVAIHWGKSHDEIPPWKKKICDYCGEHFGRIDAHTTNGNSFCDSNCYGKYKSENIDGKELPWYSGGKNEFVCDQCGNIFEEHSCFRKQKHTFCNNTCYGKWEQTDNDRAYYGPKWKRQRKYALKKSSGVCCYKNCEKTKCNNGRSLHLHHIEPLKNFDSFKEANKLSNLVPVCAEHHPKIENE